MRRLLTLALLALGAWTLEACTSASATGRLDVTASQVADSVVLLVRWSNPSVTPPADTVALIDSVSGQTARVPAALRQHAFTVGAGLAGDTVRWNICARWIRIRSSGPSAPACAVGLWARDLLPPPPPGSIDTTGVEGDSVVAIGFLMQPDARDITVGDTTQFCIFVVFADGVIANRARQASWPGCAAEFAAVQTGPVSPAHQSVADRECYVWASRNEQTGAVIETPEPCPDGQLSALPRMVLASR